MGWKRSKDGGLDYDIKTNLAYEEAKRLAFGEAEPLRNPRLEQIRKRIAEPKLNLKERLKKRIREEGSLR